MVREEVDFGTLVASPSLRERLMTDVGLLHRWTTFSGPLDPQQMVRLLVALSPGPVDQPAVGLLATRLIGGQTTPEDHEIIVPGGPRMFVFALSDGVSVGNWRPRELKTEESLSAALGVGLVVCRAMGCDAILEDEGGAQLAIIRAPEHVAR